MVIAITATGIRHNKQDRLSFEKTYKPQTVQGIPLTAIQFCTALGALSVIDYVLSTSGIMPGLHHPEDLSLEALKKSHYTHYLLS